MKFGTVFIFLDRKLLPPLISFIASLYDRMFDFLRRVIFSITRFLFHKILKPSFNALVKLFQLIKAAINHLISLIAKVAMLIYRLIERLLLRAFFILKQFTYRVYSLLKQATIIILSFVKGIALKLYTTLKLTAQKTYSLVLVYILIPTLTVAVSFSKYIQNTSKCVFFAIFLPLYSSTKTYFLLSFQTLKSNILLPFIVALYFSFNSTKTILSILFSSLKSLSSSLFLQTREQIFSLLRILKGVHVSIFLSLKAQISLFGQLLIEALYLLKQGLINIINRIQSLVKKLSKK